MEEDTLEYLGLSHNEAITYRALLKIGETKTGEIVKQTNLHRVLIYDALESLIKKGLASYIIKENIKYFRAANPENLKSFIEEREKMADKLIPELKSLQNIASKKQTVTLFEGINGLKTALNSMLKEMTSKDDHYVFASGNMEPTLGDYYYLYQQEKKRKHILTKGIVDLPYKKRTQLIKDTYATIRYYPLGPFPTDTWIYKDKVLSVTYTAMPPIAILIQSKETAESYKKIFESFWEKASKS